MWWLAVLLVLVGLLALVIFLLWVPVDIALRAECHGLPRLTVRTRWLFGLVKREGRPEKRPPRPEKAPEARRSFKEIVRDLKMLFRMLRTRGVPRQLLRLLSASIRQIKFKSLSVDLKIGLGHPADTAILFGVIGPVALLLGSRPSRTIKVYPVLFGPPSCEGYIEGAFRFRPIRFVPPMARFAFSRPVRWLLWQSIKDRWKRR